MNTHQEVSKSHEIRKTESLNLQSYIHKNWKKRTCQAVQLTPEKSWG